VNPLAPIYFGGDYNSWATKPGHPNATPYKPKKWGIKAPHQSRGAANHISK